MHGGTALNVISDEVKLEFTVRILEPSVRKEIPKLIERTVKGITESVGAKYEFIYDFCLPPVINEKNSIALVKKVGEAY